MVGITVRKIKMDKLGKLGICHLIMRKHMIN